MLLRDKSLCGFIADRRKNATLPYANPHKPKLRLRVKSVSESPARGDRMWPMARAVGIRSRKINKPREGRKKLNLEQFRVEFLSPLAGLSHTLATVPTADAVGYILPPLQGFSDTL
jgi:hypothetical protein